MARQFQTVEYVPNSYPVVRHVPVTETVEVPDTIVRERRARIQVWKPKTKKIKYLENVPITRKVLQTRQVPVTDYETRFDQVVVNHEVENITHTYTEPVVTRSYIAGSQIPYSAGPHAFAPPPSYGAGPLHRGCDQLPVVHTTYSCPVNCSEWRRVGGHSWGSAPSPKPPY